MVQGHSLSINSLLSPRQSKSIATLEHLRIRLGETGRAETHEYRGQEIYRRGGIEGRKWDSQGGGNLD